MVRANIRERIFIFENCLTRTVLKFHETRIFLKI